jgi:hypothetical protein
MNHQIVVRASWVSADTLHKIGWKSVSLGEFLTAHAAIIAALAIETAAHKVHTESE